MFFMKTVVERWQCAQTCQTLWKKKLKTLTSIINLWLQKLYRVNAAIYNMHKTTGDWQWSTEGKREWGNYILGKQMVEVFSPR